MASKKSELNVIMDIENMPKTKSLHNSDENPTTKNVGDLTFFGNKDSFKLICKASSEAEGWMKSTKALEIMNVGCIVQVTTQQRNFDGSYSVAEAVTFVPGVKIWEDVVEGEVVARELVHYRDR